MANLTITQVRSIVGTRREHRETMRSLGLKKIGQSVERPDSPQLRGMVHSVQHLVKVEASEAVTSDSEAG